jgi:hypothetical protein
MVDRQPLCRPHDLVVAQQSGYYRGPGRVMDPVEVIPGGNVTQRHTLIANFDVSLRSGWEMDNFTVDNERKATHYVETDASGAGLQFCTQQPPGAPGLTALYLFDVQATKGLCHRPADIGGNVNVDVADSNFVPAQAKHQAPSQAIVDIGGREPPSHLDKRILQAPLQHGSTSAGTAGTATAGSRSEPLPEPARPVPIPTCG